MSLRGSAEDLVYTEVHSSSESLSARASLGRGRSERNSSGDTSSRVGESGSTRCRHEACAAVRLVNKDGDVIWSTTQECRGAKFRGASADVAEKITRQLVEDIAKAKRAGSPKAAPAVSR